ALHHTPSAVSQRIKALEQRTGRVLVTRTKPVRPTDSGRIVVRFARRLAALQRDTQRELGIADEAAPAHLSIAVNADSLATWFLPALTRLPQDPPIFVDLHRQDEDHTATLLREGRVMAAVTSSSEPVAGCTVRPLGAARYLPCATPDFIARHLTGAPLPDRLPDAPVIVFDRTDDLQDTFVRSLCSRAACRDRHHIPTSEGYRDAVAAGLGWGLLPEPHATPLLAAGVVANLTPGRWVDVPLYW